VADHAAGLTADERVDIQDLQRRIKVIFIDSIGNLVEPRSSYSTTEKSVTVRYHTRNFGAHDRPTSTIALGI